MSTNADEENCAKRARMESRDPKSDPNKQELLINTVEYKPNAGNSSLSNTGYTSTNSHARTATKETGIMSSSLKTAPASKDSDSVGSMKKQGSKRALLEIELIQDKIRNQKIKHQKELAHQTEMFDVEYKTLLLEYEHKKKMYELVEAEQKAKIDKIRSEI